MHSNHAKLVTALGAWGPLALDSDLLLRYAADYSAGSVFPTAFDAFFANASLEIRSGDADAQYGVVVAVGGKQSGKANKTAIIPVVGPVTPFAAPKIYEIFGIRTAALPNIVAAARAAAADPEIGRIVLAIHSPGGSAFGVMEAAAALREVAKVKPLVASVNYLAASAAYWLASAASEIVATNHALVGSVGAMITHMDYSRALDREGVTPTVISIPASKTEVSDMKPLSEAGRAELTDIVREIYQAFKSDVSAARGVDMDKVGDQYGRVHPTTGALKLGMIDRVATFDQLLGEAPQGRDFTATRRARLAILEHKANA